MPTYQYVCTECGSELEVVQKFTDDPLTVHETCGGKLRKVFSAVGIVFKGSGFYRTDSRKDSSNSSTPGPDSSSSSSSDSSKSSGESNSSGESKKSSGSSDSSSSKASPSPSSSSGEKVA